MRKYYLDNLRTIMILLLFPVHTFMVWNDFGEKFYVWGGENRILSTLIVVVNPWFMTVLFAIAGMCAGYSLEKRGVKGFVGERLKKLLLPFVSGLVLIVPLQPLCARKFFYNFEGSILENYGYFFTHFTDLSGYDGGFTPGHLWFILYLFIISLLSLIVIKLLPRERIEAKIKKLNTVGLILLFVPVWLLYYLGNFGGLSLGKYLAVYLIGYYVLSSDEIIEKLSEKRKPLLILFCVLQTALTVLYYFFSFYGDFTVNLVGWLGVLTCLACGKAFIDKKTKLSELCAKASYPVYILHQSILVVLAYWTLSFSGNTILSVTIILFGSFTATVLIYEAIKRIPYFRKLFGIR